METFTLNIILNAEQAEESFDKMIAQADQLKEIFQKIKPDASIHTALQIDMRQEVSEEAKSDTENKTETEASNIKKFFALIKSEIDKVNQDIRSFEDGLKSVFSQSFEELKNQMQSLVVDGKANFKDLAKIALDELQQVGLEMAILKPMMGGLSSMFSFSEGGVMTDLGPASLPLRSYADGGVATRPQMAVFGEGSGPEAFVPLKNNKIPVQIETARNPSPSTQNLHVNTQIHLNSTGSDDKDGGNSSDSSTLNELAERIRSMIVSELLEQSREGGILHQLQK